MSYYLKYLKYKNKYLELKNQFGFNLESKGQFKSKYYKQIGGAWVSGVDFGKLCNDSATTNKFPRDLDLNGWEKNTYSVKTDDLLTFKNVELDKIYFPAYGF